MKKCPFCAEEIQDEAIKCRYCGSDLKEGVGKAGSTTVAIKSGETLGLIMLILPLCTSFLVFFWIGGMNLLEAPWSKFNLLIAITIIGTAILATIEASKLGIGNPSDVNKKGIRNTGPIGWFFAMVLLWGVAYPVYLFIRRNYGLKNYLVPGVFIVIIFLCSFSIMGSNINQRIKEVQQQGEKFQQEAQKAMQAFENIGQEPQITEQYSNEDADAKSILRALSIASEAFATANSGYYPSSIADLINSNPPYFNQNVCNTTVGGYSYTCVFSNTEYTFTATPIKAGGQTYTISTGGELHF